MYYIGNNLFQVQFADKGSVILACLITGRTEHYRLFDIMHRDIGSKVQSYMSDYGTMVPNFTDMKKRMDSLQRLDNLEVSEIIYGLKKINEINNHNTYYAAINCLNYAHSILDFDENHDVKSDVDRVVKLVVKHES